MLLKSTKLQSYSCSGPEYNFSTLDQAGVVLCGGGVWRVVCGVMVCGMWCGEQCCVGVVCGVWWVCVCCAVILMFISPE
jgi:hypothetical protein